MVIGSLQSQLEALGVDIVEVLEHSRWPVSIVDASGVCVWLNGAAIDWVGARLGGSINSIAEDYLPPARAALKRRQMGADEVTHHGFVVSDRHGARRHLELLSISLTRG